MEGSAALALVASGVVFGGPFMIAALSSEVALSPEDAASAVVALGFFFVMLQELKNANVFYIHMPGLWSSIFPPGATPRLAKLRRRIQGYEWVGIGQVTRLLDGYAYHKSTRLNEFRTPSLHAINHDKIAPPL